LAGIERKKVKNRHEKAIIYGFRKRFHTTLILTDGLNPNIAEKLMGHKNGSDGNYLRPTPEQCFFEFEKAIPDLTLDPTERQKLTIEDLSKQNSNLELLYKDSITSLSDQMITLSKELEELKRRPRLTHS